MVLIYSHANRLFIHSRTIIHKGGVDILKGNKRVLRYRLSDTDFFTCVPGLRSGYYTVSVYSDNGETEKKRVYLSGDEVKNGKQKLTQNLFIL